MIRLFPPCPSWPRREKIYLKCMFNLVDAEKQYCKPSFQHTKRGFRVGGQTAEQIERARCPLGSRDRPLIELKGFRQVFADRQHMKARSRNRRSRSRHVWRRRAGSSRGTRKVCGRSSRSFATTFIEGGMCGPFTAISEQLAGPSVGEMDPCASRAPNRNVDVLGFRKLRREVIEHDAARSSRCAGT